MKQEVIKWAKRVGEEVAKRSPSILTVVAVVGSAATAVLAGKATLQAKAKLDAIKELEENGHEKFTTKEKAKNIVPIYIPTFLMFTTTSACIIGAHQIDTKRQLAIASAYSLSTEALKELENKIKDTYGEKKFVKLTDEINEEKGRQIYMMKLDGIIDTGHGDQVFIDIRSGQVFRSSMEHVKRVIMDIQDEVGNGYDVDINDFYRRIGIREIKGGDRVVWIYERTGRPDPKLTTGYIDPETKDIVCHVLDWYNDPVTV